MARLVGTNTYGVAKFVVSSDATKGNFTTIQAAINAASSGDSIYVLAGSYNETLSLKAGVLLYTGLSQGTNNINRGGVQVGQGIILPASGICIVQGFYFSFGATANMVTDVAGTADLYMYNCDWNYGGGVCFSCTNGQTGIYLENCNGSNSTSAFYQIASGGKFRAKKCILQSNTTTPAQSTATAGSVVEYYNSQIGFPTTLTGLSANSFYAENCRFFTSQSLFVYQNNTVITTVTSGSYPFNNCIFFSGSASAISIGSGTTVTLTNANINSSNTNAVTGAGTLAYTNISFSGTSSVMNTTTQTANYTNLGKWKASGQPAFLAYNSITRTNVTGDGTNYTVIFDTEVFDQNNNFNGTSTFTAPVTGRYYLQAAVFVTGGSNITGTTLQIVTSNRTYRNDGPVVPGVLGITTPEFSSLCDMDTGDTATVVMTTSDSGGKIDDVLGAASPFTWFSGFLAC